MLARPVAGEEKQEQNFHNIFPLVAHHLRYNRGFIYKRLFLNATSLREDKKDMLREQQKITTFVALE